MTLYLPDDSTGHSAAVHLLLTKCIGGSPKVHKGSKLLRFEADGATLTEVNAICKCIARSSCPEMLGSSPAEIAQVEQWMSFGHTRFALATDDALLELNEVLAKRVFIVNNRLTVADLCLYVALSSAVVSLPIAQQSTFCHILRWYDHIHHVCDANTDSPPLRPAVSLPPAMAPQLPPPSAPLATKPRADSSAASASTAANAVGKGRQPKAVATSSAAAGQKDSAAAGSSGPGGAQSSNAAKKAVRKGASDAVAGEGAPPAGAAPDNAAAAAAGKKVERAAKNAAKNAPGATDAGGPRGVDVLNIRVGTIVKVQKHPDADALYLEEIDVGEDVPRQVVSGLVKWVPQEEMQGRRVAVLLNLKPAKMRGVTSYGMVLCASTDSAVEPLSVPEGVPNGDRVMVDGYANEPEAQLNPKKKILEALLPDMQTSAEGVACFKGTPFATSKGPLASKILNAPVK